MKRTFFTIFLLLFSLRVAALDCLQCGKEIRGNYIYTSTDYFCSQECFHANLPKCSVCKEPCVNGYLTMGDRLFCSQNCMSQVYYCSICKQGLNNYMMMKDLTDKGFLFCKNCAELPKCYFCYMPTDGKKISDKHAVCATCSAAAVKSRQKLDRIFRKVRADLAKLYGYEARHRIELIPVSVAKMRELSKEVSYGDADQRMGLMMSTYSENRKSAKNSKQPLIIHDCKIYVIENMPEILLYEVLSHELTHDHLRHKVGLIDDISAEEGVCNLVSALYNKYLGREYLNVRMENNTDPVYGDGYRKMKKRYIRYNNNLTQLINSLKN